MKRFLCVILTLVCVFALCSCDILNQDSSTEPEANSTTTTSKADGETTPENKTEDTVPDVTTHEKAPDETTLQEEPVQTTPAQTTPEDSYPCDTTPEQTTPEDTTPEETTPKETTPEETTPDVTEPESTTADEDIPVVPDEETITVRVTYQSGGVHCVESVITTTGPATLLEVYNLFANEHPYEMFSNVDCYLNDKPIDPTETIYMQDGDKVYLQENGKGYHLHIWEIGLGQCRSCLEKCPHDWDGIVCRMCKCECRHEDDWNNSTWVNGQCEQCGTYCQHETWDDNSQCIVCGYWMGVNLIEIEIYEDGEYKYYTQVNQITLLDLIMAYYGYPWGYMVDTYEFYYNGMLITEGSYTITESGRVDFITRGGNTGGDQPSNPESPEPPENPDTVYNMSYSILTEDGECFQGDYQFNTPTDLASLLNDTGHCYIDFGMGYRVTVNNELIEDSYGKGAYFLMIDQSCVVTVEPTIKILLRGYNDVFYAAESENLCFYDVAQYYGLYFDEYFWFYMENEMLAGEDMVTKLHYGNYNQIHEIKLRERKIVFHIEVINRYGDITTYCTPELDLMYGVTLQEVIDAYGIWGVDYTWEMIDVGSGYVSVPIDFSYSFALPLMVDETYICENNATYLLRATSVHFAADGSGG